MIELTGGGEKKSVQPQKKKHNFSLISWQNKACDGMQKKRGLRRLGGGQKWKAFTISSRPHFMLQKRRKTAKRLPTIGMQPTITSAPKSRQKRLPNWLSGH